MDYYQSFIHSLEEGFCIIEVIFNDKNDPIDYRFLDYNSAFEKQTGLNRVVGKTMKELAPNHEKHWFDIYGRVALTGEPSRIDNIAAEPGHFYRVYAYRIGNPEERKVAILFWDISKEKKVEEELVRKEKNFKATLDNLLEGCAIISYDWEFLYANPRYAERVQLKQEDIIGRKVLEVFPGIEENAYYKAITKCMQEREYQNVEDSFTFSDGSTRWIILFAHPVPEGVFILSVDVTRRKTAEIKLQNALNEKELLLKELYHRTKNNMQVISSLLNIRAQKIKDPSSRSELLEMKDRINAMSLVHKKLYQSQSLTYLDLSSYVTDLVNLLKMSQPENTSNIELEFDMEESPTTVDTAITLGLVITELIINVFKYAFPENRDGKLSITLNKSDSKTQLIISDNGVGMPAEIKEESMGLNLVKDLVVEQLDGSITLQTSSSGTSWRIVI